MQMVTVFGSNTQLGMIQFDKTQFFFVLQRFCSVYGTDNTNIVDIVDL